MLLRTVDGFIGRLLRPVAFLAVLLPLTAAAIEPGTYRCQSYNVSGGGGNCRLAPPIVIHPDGSYQESSTRGSYRVSENRVYFSESKIRGPGVVSGQNQITFEYDYRGWRHTVTYSCRDCGAGGRAASSAPAAASSAPAAASPGALVWAQVRLQFAAPDGYLGWANSAHLVPLEQARAFAASSAATPPAGSATGSAYLDGRQTVVANFRRAAGGRDYVVFLDSGRERIPVASLHVPASPAEQTLSVNANLKHTPAPPASPRSKAPDPAGPSSAPDYPRIGVEVMDVTPEIAQAVGDPGLKGAGVRGVQPGAPAERSGVRAGDIITSVNGVSVSNAQGLTHALVHRRDGRPSELVIFRDRQLIDIVVP